MAGRDGSVGSMRRSGTLHLLGLFAVAVQCASVGWARNEVKDAFLDLAVPDSPAFVALGVTPSSVQRPGSPRDLGVALLSGITKDGQFEGGLALEFTPYLLAAGNRLSLTEYNANLMKRLLSNFQVSLASTRKSAQNGVSEGRIGVGFRLTPFNAGDPRRDTELWAQFHEILGDFSEPEAPPESAGEGKVLPKTQAGLETAREASRKRNWNRSALELAAAFTFASEDGSFDRLEGDSEALWITGSLKLGSAGQLILHGLYRHATQGEDAGKRWFAGGRLRAGSPTWAWSGEAGVYKLNPEGEAANDSWWRITTGFEVKLSSGVWLEAAIGGETGRAGKDSKLLSLSNLKWTFGESRILIPEQ